MENVPSQEAKAEKKQPLMREEDLPGHLEKQGEQKDKEKPVAEREEGRVENDAQIKHAFELLKGWEVFKHLVQKR